VAQEELNDFQDAEMHAATEDAEMAPPPTNADMQEESLKQNDAQSPAGHEPG
jgi:hypothetical protein